MSRPLPVAQVTDALDLELWRMIDDWNFERRQLTRTRVVLGMFAMSGVGAAGALLACSLSWMRLVAAFLIAFLAGPAGGLLAAGVGDRLAHRTQGSLPRSPGPEPIRHAV